MAYQPYKYTLSSLNLLLQQHDESMQEVEQSHSFKQRFRVLQQRSQNLLLCHDGMLAVMAQVVEE